MSGESFQYSAMVAAAKGDALWGDAFGEVKVDW
jgi:hypothetical protein